MDHGRFALLQQRKANDKSLKIKTLSA